jgi:hypothetical protein
MRVARTPSLDIVGSALAPRRLLMARFQRFGPVLSTASLALVLLLASAATPWFQGSVPTDLWRSALLQGVAMGWSMK